MHGGLVWFVVGIGGALLFDQRRPARELARQRWQRLALPVDAPRVTAHGGYGETRPGPPAHTHQGLDLIAPAGSVVRVVGDGRIVATSAGLGKLVRKLRLEPQGAWSERGALVTHVVYADLGDATVNAGDRVRTGDAIGHAARAGFVHFAVKRTGASGEEFFDPARAGFAYRTSEKGAA